MRSGRKRETNGRNTSEAEGSGSGRRTCDRQSGFEATAVYSGEKAVEMARSLRPNMLISDVIMTDMNGIDAAIQIRGILPDCKILLFSGQAATADLLEGARAKGHEFEILAKPVHPQDLLARLRS
jgi:CheY-like chemotaxis protein